MAMASGAGDRPRRDPGGPRPCGSGKEDIAEMTVEAAPATHPLLALDDAIRTLRLDPAFEGLVRDAYLGRDVADSWRRFATSAEFHEVLGLLGGRLADATVVDLGAGIGIAAAAFSAAGARRVIAVEPDASDEVGRGAIARGGNGFEVLDAMGEDLPLPDASVDIVYLRQVLHHAQDLDRLIAEAARVLRPLGVFLACREHVVDDDAQLRAFLSAHPINRLAGGEHGFALDRYQAAITRAGLILDRTYGPYESIINAFPIVRSAEELQALPVTRLEQKFGAPGRLLGRIPPVQRVAWRRIDRREPGRLVTFLAHKP